MQVVRGTNVKFKAQFLDSDGEPLVSADETKWPAIVIRNPDGEDVFNAVGHNITQGNYQFDWFVPVDTPLNKAPNRWSINWYFTNAYDHTRSTEQFFDVVDKIVPTEEEAQEMYLTRIGTRERLVLPLEDEPAEISLTIMDDSFNTIAAINQVATQPSQALESESFKDRKIGLVIEDSMYKYYYNTEPFSSSGLYNAFWSVRDSVVSPKNEEQQVIRVPENKYWLFNKSLRMLIDKLRKKLVTFQAYTEDQIYEFMIRGLGFVNGIEPATDWTLSTIPERVAYGVAEAMLLSAAKYALIAQQVLETELSFDHSGQTVTLAVNHDYSGVIGHIDTMLDKFAEAKPRLYRISCPIGLVGTRRYNLGWRNKVWKISGRTGILNANTLGSQLVMAMNL